SHVVIIRKGTMLYSGQVDEMNASHGFIELKTANIEKLQELLSQHPSIGRVSLNEGLITAILEEPMEAEALNSWLFSKGIVLSYLVKRKESLEEQFLQLTNQTSN